MQPLSQRKILAAIVGLTFTAACAGPVARPAPPTKAKDAARPARPAASSTDPLARAIAGFETRKVTGAAGAGILVNLAGKARVISDHGGGIISDHGAGVISNNSGGIISDNGAGIISDNGGGLIANNGSGLTSKTKYGLRQAAGTLPEFLLADAIVTVHDAAGRLLVDQAGSPITTTTDRQGGYKLTASLPAENLVVRIKLWHGGTLSAILPREAQPPEAARGIDLDTASSIGASYVLREFVRGDQAIYDKLPASEAARLTRQLQAAQQLVAAAPRYDEAELVAIGDDLRARDAAVDRTLADIKVLLLGQANLGGGRRADEVPLSAPEALAVDAAGRLLIGERGLGRIRVVAPDGTISTWADTAFGTVRHNFYEVDRLAVAPDGRVIVLSKEGLSAIAPDGTVTNLALGKVGSIQVGLAVTADGTIYVGHAGGGQRITAVPPGGAPREVPIGTPGLMWAMAAGPDGRLYALCREEAGSQGEIWRGSPEGLTERVAVVPSIRNETDLAVGTDGTIYVTAGTPSNVYAIGPDGSPRALAGPEGSEPGGRELLKPTYMHLAPDGTLYVSDIATSFVHARAPEGRWRRVAGTHARVQDLARGEVSVNGPGGAEFDAAGRLVFTEVGSNTVKRFDGQRIETIAGTIAGFSGDGGPATAARLELPRGLAIHGDDIYVMDTQNERLRKISANGIIETVAGAPGKDLHVDLQPGRTYSPGEFSLWQASGLTTDLAGRPVWSTRHQLIRLEADGSARVLAGRAAADAEQLFDLTTLLGTTFPGPALDSPFGLAIGIAHDPRGTLHVVDASFGNVLALDDAGGPAPVLRSVAGIPFLEQMSAAGTTHVIPAEAADARALAFIIPAGICFDQAGNMYVAEMGTKQLSSASAALGSKFPFDAETIGIYPARVRKIAPDGRVTTIAGPGGRVAPNPDAEDALVYPTGLAISRDGRLAILDPGANTIRILPAGSF